MTTIWKQVFQKNSNIISKFTNEKMINEQNIKTDSAKSVTKLNTTTLDCIKKICSTPKSEDGIIVYEEYPENFSLNTYLTFDPYS